jgi:hypothetical protein
MRNHPAFQWRWTEDLHHGLDETIGGGQATLTKHIATGSNLWFLWRPTMMPRQSTE